MCIRDRNSRLTAARLTCLFGCGCGAAPPPSGCSSCAPAAPDAAVRPVAITMHSIKMFFIGSLPVLQVFDRRSLDDLAASHEFQVGRCLLYTSDAADERSS